MGYWDQNEEGNSFATADSGEEMLWGDQPADIIGNALDEVKWVFIKDLGRLPTLKEVMAGITFSTRVGLDDLPKTVAEATVLGDKAISDSNLTEQEVDALYYAATRGDEDTPQRVIDAQKNMSDLARKFYPEGAGT